MTINKQDVTRSDIMKRAWQLKHNQKDRELGESLSMAWREVKNGEFGEWQHLSIKAETKTRKAIEKLKIDLLCLEMKDFWNNQDKAEMSAIKDRIGHLENDAAGLCGSIA